VVDEFGTIVYKSPSTEQHLGYRPDDLIGRNLFEFVHPDDIPRVRASFDDCRRRDVASPSIEHRLRHVDGLWRTFESVGRFQPDGAGGRIGIIHSRDVSSRKLLEAQVRQAQKMEAVGLSTGAIAHDFNNMLVVIAGYTALLATDPSQTVREFAREMRMATDRATELTSQLLSFAPQQPDRRAALRRQRRHQRLPSDSRPHGRPRRARLVRARGRAVGRCPWAAARWIRCSSTWWSTRVTPCRPAASSR
jgi:PAS domain S-box-containing protein